MIFSTVADIGIYLATTVMFATTMLCVTAVVIVYVVRSPGKTVTITHDEPYWHEKTTTRVTDPTDRVAVAQRISDEIIENIRADQAHRIQADQPRRA